MAKTKTVKYEEVLRAYLNALRTDDLSRGAIEFGGFAAGTSDQVADLVAAARRVDALVDEDLHFKRGGTRAVQEMLTAMRQLRTALAALDREAQP